MPVDRDSTTAKDDAKTLAIIAKNLVQVSTDILDACHRAGRDRESVRLIGVTKYVDAATTAMLVQAGCGDVGENRPQVLWQKAESGVIDDHVRWHMIGHLQRNKVRRMLRQPVMVHSIDSRRLAESIGEESVAVDRTTDGLLEINISREDAKTGLLPDQARQILDAGPIPGLRWRGLMAMASQSGDTPEQFAAVARLRDSLQSEFQLDLPELSMGMSGDYADAIAEGATMVRVGSNLFKGILDH